MHFFYKFTHLFYLVKVDFMPIPQAIIEHFSSHFYVGFEGGCQGVKTYFGSGISCTNFTKCTVVIVEIAQDWAKKASAFNA